MKEIIDHDTVGTKEMNNLFLSAAFHDFTYLHCHQKYIEGYLPFDIHQFRV